MRFRSTVASITSTGVSASGPRWRVAPALLTTPDTGPAASKAGHASRVRWSDPDGGAVGPASSAARRVSSAAPGRRGRSRAPGRARRAPAGGRSRTDPRVPPVTSVRRSAVTGASSKSGSRSLPSQLLGVGVHGSSRRRRPGPECAHVPAGVARSTSTVVAGDNAARRSSRVTAPAWASPSSGRPGARRTTAGPAAGSRSASRWAAPAVRGETVPGDPGLVVPAARGAAGGPGRRRALVESTGSLPVRRCGRAGSRSRLMPVTRLGTRTGRGAHADQCSTTRVRHELTFAQQDRRAGRRDGCRPASRSRPDAGRHPPWWAQALGPRRRVVLRSPPDRRWRRPARRRVVVAQRHPAYVRRRRVAASSPARSTWGGAKIFDRRGASSPARGSSSSASPGGRAGALQLRRDPRRRPAARPDHHGRHRPHGRPGPTACSTPSKGRRVDLRPSLRRGAGLQTSPAPAGSPADAQPGRVPGLADPESCRSPAAVDTALNCPGPTSASRTVGSPSSATMSREDQRRLVGLAASTPSVKMPASHWSCAISSSEQAFMVAAADRSHFSVPVGRRRSRRSGCYAGLDREVAVQNVEGDLGLLHQVVAGDLDRGERRVVEVVGGRRAALPVGRSSVGAAGGEQEGGGEQGRAGYGGAFRTHGFTDDRTGHTVTAAAAARRAGADDRDHLDPALRAGCWWRCCGRR